ncbi:MAG: NTP transferase domain-containing protein, partial [Clostridiales bacterium]|nr:NTP transferase domain-containing protein [Clostridiales bacterium]
MEISAVVMAAGRSTRMKSKHSKVVFQVSGKAIIQWVADALFDAGCRDQVYIVGEAQDEIRSILGENVAYVLQEEQRGTGHAVMQAAPFLEGRDGLTIVLPGDCPMVSVETIRKALSAFETAEGNCAAMLITAEADDPTGYGRIVRGEDGNVVKIVEHKDCTPEELKIKEINSSMYVFKTPLLLSALGRIGANNAQKEYYLTDTIGILIGDGYTVGAVVCDFDDTRGINDRIQLAQVQQIMNRRILERHMKAGVTIIDPATTWIHHAVEIGQDTTILPGTTLMGNTVIGCDCLIGENSRIDCSEIGDETVVDNSIVTQSRIGKDCRIGPYSHIRPDCVIDDHVTLGAYVEV